jgi:transglutaminase superfamily protein
MKKKSRRFLIACVTVAVLAAALLLPGLPWSARCRHMTRRAAARLGVSVASWRGSHPRPVSLSGHLTGGGALAEALKGAQVVAIESASGYMAATDAEGRFTLPHLTWYPDAAYTLVVTADAYHARTFTLHAPPAYPDSGTVEAGDLRFEDGAEVAPSERPAHFLRYDRENRDYYRQLFERLTAGASGDHEKVAAVCRYVASRHNPNEDPFRFKSARQILECGAPHCSNLAFAMAAITAAGGYPSRTVHTSDTPDYAHTHVATEVFYGDAWHLYDPTYGVSFTDRAGDVASYRQLRLTPGLITPAAFARLDPAAAAAALGWMPAAYGSGLCQMYQVNEAAFVDACSRVEVAFRGL